MSLAIAQRKISYGRIRLALFANSAIAGIIALHILDLGLDRLAFKLTLIPLLVAGFVFSYYLEEVYQRGVRLIVNGLSILAFLFYVRLIFLDPFSLGNWLGMLLGVLTVLLAFVAFNPSTHRLFATIGVVFTLFSSVTSYEFKIVFFFPLFLVFASALLYFANYLELIERRPQDELAGQLSGRASNISVSFMIVRLVLVVFLLSVVVYIVVPHYSDIDRPAFLLPRGGSIPESFSEIRLGPEVENLEKPETELDITGFSESFDLSGGNSVFGPRRLFESDERALVMRSAQNAYLRGIVFDVYLGNSWVRSSRAEERSAEPLDGSSSYSIANSYAFPLIDFASRSLVKKLRMEKGITPVKSNVFSVSDPGLLDYNFNAQEIEFLKDHPPVLFSSYQPVRLEGMSIVRTADGSVEEPYPTLDGFSVLHTSLLRHPARYKYTVTVLSPKFKKEDLKLSPFTYPKDILEHYTQLPTTSNLRELEAKYSREVVPVPDRVFRLARSLVEGAKSPAEKVERIYNFLREKFRYTLEFPELPPGKEASEYFLFNTQAGFCMQFASTMAVLLRANGIPARVVGGYAPGQYSILNNKYIFRDRNAHAWVEVYFDGFGWIMFDPSPTSSDIFTLSTLKSFASSTVNFLENLFVIDPQGAQRAIVGFFRGLYVYLAPKLARMWQAGVIAVICVLMGSLAGALILRKRRRPEEFQPENEIVAHYLFVESLLRKVQLPREKYETVTDYFKRIRHLLKPMEDGLARFAKVYSWAAFSGRAPSAQEVAWSRKFVGELESFLRASASQDKSEGNIQR